MISWPASALVVFVGIIAGPHGLNLISRSVLLLLDPAIAMALAMLGIFVGLGLDAHRPRLTVPAGLALFAGVTAAALRQTDPSALTMALGGIAVVAIVIASAGWLLVGQTDSEREQQVFVVGSLLLIGGSAVYSSLSAVFAGVLAGAVWNAAGNLARARIVRHLEYFQRPLIGVMLVAAGASLVFSREAIALVIIVGAFHGAGRAVSAPFPVTAGIAAIAVALDIFRGALR